MVAPTEGPKNIVKVEGLGDVVDLLNQINEGIDTGQLSDQQCRIKLGVSKGFISVAGLVIQNKRIERGKRPEKELRLKAPLASAESCKCGQDVKGVKFCSNCGTPVPGAAPAAAEPAKS